MPRRKADQDLAKVPTGAEQSAACMHHWIIQPASGPVSEGACQNCGEVKEFKNYVQANTWDHDDMNKKPPSHQRNDEEDYPP